MNRSILGSVVDDDFDAASIYTNKKKLNPAHQLALLLVQARKNQVNAIPLGCLNHPQRYIIPDYRNRAYRVVFENEGITYGGTLYTTNR